MKEEKLGWQKAEPVENFYAKYDPNKTPPNHEATIPNQIEKEVKAFSSDLCVTNEAKKKPHSFTERVTTMAL